MTQVGQVSYEFRVQSSRFKVQSFELIFATLNPELNNAEPNNSNNTTTNCLGGGLSAALHVHFGEDFAEFAFYGSVAHK